jgi:hypothetical protein
MRVISMMLIKYKSKEFTTLLRTFTISDQILNLSNA